MVSLNQLRKKSPREFERFVANVLSKMDYKHIKLTSYTSDSGYDIEAFKNNKRVLFECKRYSEYNKVGSREIRIFADACRRRKAVKGVFITTSDFTKNVWKEQKERSLSLEFWDGQTFLEKIRKGSQKYKASPKVNYEHKKWLKNYVKKQKHRRTQKFCINCKKKLEGFYTRFDKKEKILKRFPQELNSFQQITIKEAISNSLNLYIPVNPILCEECKFITECSWCNENLDMRKENSSSFLDSWVHDKCLPEFKKYLGLGDRLGKRLKIILFFGLVLVSLLIIAITISLTFYC
jgi:hypothetical protein